MYRKFQGDCLPGGYDHFNWVIFDEVHAIDGEDGDALQRLIRSMSCKFLALSATVGNAKELRGWLERVRGDQLLGMLPYCSERRCSVNQTALYNNTIHCSTLQQYTITHCTTLHYTTPHDTARHHL